jgi:phage tail-like protein
MADNNTDYLYSHLPARMRRDDAEMFLKRFLSFFGETLDGFDLVLDTFYQRIAPETASSEFIDWWLYSMFGWGWFPVWFARGRRRAFYAAITGHYAKRGTAVGIREFLAAFGLRVVVESTPLYWGDDATWGDDVWAITGPLGIVIRLFPEAPAINEDLEFWGEGTWDESIAVAPGENIQIADVDELLRFVWPIGNIIMIEDVQFPTTGLHGAVPGYGDAEYGSTLPG